MPKKEKNEEIVKKFETNLDNKEHHIKASSITKIQDKDEKKRFEEFTKSLEKDPYLEESFYILSDIVQ